jgi:hypothetical protein
MVSSLECASPDLVKNTRVGGYPDLLPRDVYADNYILKGSCGIEIKASKNSTWQGHNVEEGWILAIKYSIRNTAACVSIDAVYAAFLSKDDWTFCQRKENSRRTPTASINKKGLKKLRDALVYKKWR